MTTPHLRKYEFGHSLINKEGLPILREVQIAQKEGYTDGYQKGYAQAQSEIEFEIANSVRKIAENISELLEQQAKAYEFITGTTLLLVKHISRKLFPKMLSEKAEEEVVEFSTEVLKCIDIHKHMTFSVHPDILEGVKSKLQDLSLKNENFELKIDSNPELNRSDCQLTWQDGGIEKFSARILDEIDQILEGAANNFPIPEKKEIKEPPQEDVKESGTTQEKEEQGEKND